jgi:hypothetical protein
MSIAYDLWFVAVWGSAVLAIPASIGLFIWLAVSAVPLIVSATPHEHDHGLRIALLAVAIVLLVAWTVVLRNHRFRVFIRAGAFPAICRGDASPSDELELRQFVVDCVKRNGKPRSLVGGGWSMFLKRRGPPAPRLFTDNFSGKHYTNTTLWKAGTTIARVQKHFKKQGQTLPHLPTMQYISIGSWLACANHGNAGDASPPIDDVIVSAVVLNMMSNTTKTLYYREARTLFDSKDAYKYMVLYVEFASVPDILIQKRGIIVDDEESAAEWLQPGANLRMLFLGAARDYAIGLRWEKQYSNTNHRDPHFGTVCCGWFQIDLCSVIGGWNESMKVYDGKVLLSDANRWTPPIFPIMNIMLICSGLRNFEIFVPLGKVLDAKTASVLLKELIQMHKRLGGRCEFRYGKLQADTILYLDFSLSRGFDQPFRLLYDRLGIRRVALHPGKWSDLSTAPCARVSVSTLVGRGTPAP